jgi:hypothetical protein
MALDFPANPTDGQVYGSYIYYSASGVWKAREESAAPAVVSPVPPTTANPGDIWVDSSDGIAYVRYDDGTSSQWIELMSSGVTSLALKANLDSPNFTGTVVLPSTTTIGSVDKMEIGYLDGVTSSIQTQINTKANIAGQDFSGKVGILGVGTQTTVGAANGTGGLEIQSTSTVAASMSFHIPGTVATNVGLNKTDSKFSIGGWSLPADSLTIDTTGRIRIPNQPSFTATRNDDGNNRAAGDYVFDKVWHNTGSNYSSSNGRFTAPVAGRYLFITQLQMWGTTVGTLANVYFRKNGTQYPSATSSEGVNGIFNKVADSGYHANVAITSVIDLAANDYVTVYQSGLRGMQSHFSGHLLG